MTEKAENIGEKFDIMGGEITPAIVGPAISAREKLEAFIADVAMQARAIPADITTKKGREARASLAFAITKIKTALDGKGAELVEESRRAVAEVDKLRKYARDTLDDLKAEIRKPLTEWETAEKARISGLEAKLHNFTIHRSAPDASSETLKATLASVTAAVPTEAEYQEVFSKAVTARDNLMAALTRDIAIAEKREADAVELELLRAEDAKRRAAEEERERAEEQAAAASRAVESAGPEDTPAGADGPPQREPEAGQPGPDTGAMTRLEGSPEPSIGPGVDVFVVDLETTGLDSDPSSEIIEMATVQLVRKEAQASTIGTLWRTLVCPRGDVPPTSRAVHHIRDAELLDAPVLSEVWAGGEICEVMASHNAPFEQHFLPRAAKHWICTYRCALVVWPDAPGHSNQVLRYWLGIDQEPDFSFEAAMPPHRALPDAYVTAFILRRLLAERPIEKLIAISKYPPLLRVMNFGKHKGTTFEAAPLDYLEWLRDKSEMGEDVKFTARYWIKKRGAK